MTEAAPAYGPAKRAVKTIRQTLRERVQVLMDRYGKTQKDLSEETGLSRSVISSWLGGKYPHEGDVVPAMQAWIARLLGGDEDFEFIKTKNAKRVFDACRFAMTKRQLVLVVGRPGLGKTEALKEFHRQSVHAGKELIYNVVNPWVKHGSLARMMARRFELPEKQTAHDLLESVAAKLRRKPGALIFDEANHFDVKCLEGIRYIYDSVRIPIVICGSIQLQRTLSDGGDKVIELEQLQSRIRLRILLEPMKLGEVKTFVERHFDSIEVDVVREFFNRSRGVVRALAGGVENTKQVMETNNLQQPTVAAVISAFENQFC